VHKEVHLYSLKAEATHRHDSNLLGYLSETDFALLRPHLKPTHIAAGSVLYSPGQNVGMVYFPCGASLVSFIVSTADGDAVETTFVGCEGAVGGIVSQGNLPAFTKIIVQFGGEFQTVSIPALEEAKLKSGALRNLFDRYADCLLAQIFQSTACNAAHTIEQRAAKWILATMDRTGNSNLPLTQEQIALMLGVGRSYISRVIGRYKQQGILDVRRGSLIINDRNSLEQHACRCNDAVRSHFDAILKGVYPGEVETND